MQLSRPHVVVEDLRIGWGSRVLMEQVSFGVERGTTFAILGESGSGKSTLLRYLIGLEQPSLDRYTAAPAALLGGNTQCVDAGISSVRRPGG